MTAHLLALASSAVSAAAILLVAAAAGVALAGRILPRGGALQTLFGTVLGLGALSYLTLARGLAGHVGSGAAVLTLALLLLPSVGGLRRTLERLVAFARRPHLVQAGPLGLIAGSLTGTFLLVALAGALAPPIYYDPLVYHFSVPKLFLLRGAIGNVFENCHSQYPSVVQMLYLLCLEVNDDITAQLLNFALGLALAAAVYLFGREFADRRTGAWAAVFLLTTEVVTMTLSRAMVDAGVTLFLFLAFFAVALWDRGEGRERGLLVLAGLLGGLGISSKYTACWLWVVLVGLVVFLSRRRGAGPRGWLADGAAALLPSALLLAPWLLKTFAYTGNPVFPFFYGVFGGAHWGPEAAARFASYNSSMGGDIGWRNWYRLPLEMFLVEGSLENCTLGPLYLLVLPIVLAVRGRPRAFRLAAWTVLLYLPYWFASAKIARYLMLVAPAAALVYAHAHTAARRPLARRAFAAAVLVSLAVNLYYLLIDELLVHRPVAVAIGVEPRAAYLARMIKSYRAMEFISERLPKSAKVFFIGETRAYHLERDHIVNSAHDPQIIARLVRAERDAGGVARRLRALGVTHILYHPEEMERLERTFHTFGWTPEERRVLDEFLATRVASLFAAHGVVVGALK